MYPDFARRDVLRGTQFRKAPWCDQAPPDFHAWLAGLMVRADMASAARARAEALRGYSFDAGTRRAAERIASIAAA